MPKTRKGPKPSEDGVSAKEFEAMANELEGFAQTLREHAGDMRELKIERLHPLMGNYDYGIDKLRNWFRKQFMPKLFEAVSASDALVKIKVQADSVDSKPTKGKKNG